MAVTALEHVNIVTDRLDETADFYVRLLGLVRGPSQGIEPGMTGAWVHVPGGPAIIHLIGYEPARHDGDGIVLGGATGALHHVALACTDFDAVLTRVRELGLAHRINDRKYGVLRQIFVHDPNNVRLELNFRGE